MSPTIEIYDTTLRDGTQGHGITFSVADKLRIAERLDAFGVAYVEGGWPGSNPRDIEFFDEAKRRTFARAKLAAFGSTRRKGVRAEDDDQVRLLIDAATAVVTIFGKTSLLHVREVLQTSREENLAMIADTVRFLKSHGRFVVYDAEHCFDGFTEDREYAMATLRAAEDAGADVVTLCDTNGGSLPGDVAAITRLACEALRVRVGIHTHDDIGLGVANALAAVEAGAPHVRTMLKRIKELEHRGYEFEAADGSLSLLIRRALRNAAPPFTVDAYHVSMRSDGKASVCEATVKVSVGGGTAHTVADGDGPVNALDAALRSALVTFYPALQSVRLTDYKVRIIDSRSGTAAVTRVLIESTDGAAEWGTIGVSENIIEASLEALVDSLEYALVRAGDRPS